MSRFIISGGGTGGHVYPAIAIAQAIRRADPDAGILFIGAIGRLEMEKVPAAGFPIEGLVISGVIRSLTWKNVTFPFKLIGSLFNARRIIRRFRPDAVIGTGGYASGPTLRVATAMGIPSLIQEQNFFPGVTNRLLGKRVQRICVAFDGMEQYFPAEKMVVTGNPVRSDLSSLTMQLPEAYSHFGLNPAKKTLLVVGGSGGARKINETIRSIVEKGLPDQVQLLWQTGKAYFQEFRQSFPDVVIVPFIDRMDLAYSCTDLIVSRAGAIAITEFAITGKPVILIPSPNVAGDHQTRNAEALVREHAGILIHDRDAIEQLPRMIDQLLNDPEQCHVLSTNILKLSRPDAADRIAEEVFQLLHKKPDSYGI